METHLQNKCLDAQQKKKLT